MAKMITSVQLIQMFVGTTVTVNVIYNKRVGNECSVVPANYKLGLAMYVSYFFLFAALFYNLYLRPGGKHAAKTQTRSAMKASESKDNLDDTLCGVKDGAGFFHTQDEKKRKEEKKTK